MRYVWSGGVPVGAGIDVGRAGAVGDNVTDDTAALQAAADEAIAEEVPLIFPGGGKIYKITSALDLRGNGLHVLSYGAQIRQHGTNVQGVKLGGTGQVVRGRLNVDYAATPTTAHTNSTAFEFYSGFMSHYECLVAERTAQCFGIGQSGWDGAPDNSLFSCTFLTLRANGFANCALDFRSWPTGGVSSTGNFMGNIYCQNNYGGSVIVAANDAVQFIDFDESSIGQLNIEHCRTTSGGTALWLQRARNMKIDSLHMEGIELTGAQASFVRIFDQSGLQVDSMNLPFNTILDSTRKSIFYVGFTGSTSKVFARSIVLRDTDNTGATTQFNAVDLHNNTDANQVVIEGFNTTDLVGDLVNNDSATTPRVEQVGTTLYKLPTLFVSTPAANASPFYLRPSGALAETFPRGAGANFQALSALTSGTLRMVAIPLLERMPIASIAVTSVGAATTPTNQWFGLFDGNRVALRLTADDTTTAWAGNTTKTLALTSTYTVPTSGLYYIGILVVAATPPTLAGSSSGNGSVPNRAPILGGNTTDTALTGPPALPFTAGVITGSGLLPYVSLH